MGAEPNRLDYQDKLAELRYVRGAAEPNPVAGRTKYTPPEPSPCRTRLSLAAYRTEAKVRLRKGRP